jgi:GTP cyclohydrolase I
MSTIHRLRPSKRANEAMGNDLSETEHSKADRPVSPLGAAVRISAIHAIHMCRTHRGVRASHGSQMITSAYFGVFKRISSARTNSFENWR